LIHAVGSWGTPSSCRMGGALNRPPRFRKEIARRVIELARKVVEDSPFVERGKLAAFIADLGLHAWLHNEAQEIAGLAVLPSFWRLGAVRSDLGLWLGCTGLGNLIASCRQAWQAHRRPSLAWAAGAAAAKVWPGPGRRFDRWLLRCTALRAGAHWSDVAAALVGAIASRALYAEARSRITEHLPLEVRAICRVRKLRLWEWDFHGDEAMLQEGLKRIIPLALDWLPHVLAAETHCRVRTELGAIGASSTSPPFARGASWSASLAAGCLCALPQPAAGGLRVPLRCWREDWHPPARAPFRDPCAFPRLHLLVEQCLGALIKEFNRLWRTCKAAFESWEDYKDWKLLGTHLFGKRVDECAAAAPWAAWVADSLGATICGYSVLLPGARIPPHGEDGRSSSTRAHVGLRVPPGSGFGLRVEEQAWNFADTIRAVLLLDFGAEPLPEAEWPAWAVTAMARQASTVRRLSEAAARAAGAQ